MRNSIKSQFGSVVSAQNEIHRAMKARTSSQVTAALRAAIFNLLMTNSPEDKGRTVKNGESEKSVDQRSGLTKALPMANARMRGMASMRSSVSIVDRGSW